MEEATKPCDETSRRFITVDGRSVLDENCFDKVPMNQAACVESGSQGDEDDVVFCQCCRDSLVARFVLDEVRSIFGDDAALVKVNILHRVIWRHKKEDQRLT